MKSMYVILLLKLIGKVLVLVFSSTRVFCLNFASKRNVSCSLVLITDMPWLTVYITCTSGCNGGTFIYCRCHGQVESNVRELMGNMVKTEQEVINMSV